MRRILPVFVALATLSACGRDTVDASLLERADALLLQARPMEALPLAKAYVAAFPEDASGHLLLGACYRISTPDWLMLADGEFETAAALFKRTGRRGALSRFTDDKAFRIALYRFRALVDMRWTLDAINRNVKEEYVHKLARRCAEHVEEGLSLNPEDAELLQMRSALGAYLDTGARPEDTQMPPARVAV